MSLETGCVSHDCLKLSLPGRRAYDRPAVSIHRTPTIPAVTRCLVYPDFLGTSVSAGPFGRLEWLCVRSPVVNLRSTMALEKHGDPERLLVCQLIQLARAQSPRGA